MSDAAPPTLLESVRRLPPDRRILPSTTVAELMARVDRLAADLAARDVRDEAVGIRMEYGPNWVLGLLALLAAGAKPLLLNHDAPDAEARRLLAAAGGGGWLVEDGRGLVTLAGERGEAREQPPCILLYTSGATGSPKLVARTEASLLAEGRRYLEAEAVRLTKRDVLLLPAPLSHAYCLGWLFAGLMAGAEVVPVPPTAFARIAEELAQRATIVVLVPALARLIAVRRSRRAADGDGEAAPNLRLAMVGAGPVDEALNESFHKAFGIGLARNYGSTELGAVLCGPAGLSPWCVGEPMPGVRLRLRDPDSDSDSDFDSDVQSAEGPGLLDVQIAPDPAWRGTGDLAVRVEGGVRILGREGHAIRRGGRWVSPVEIESVLRGHPRVRDVRVRGRARAHGGEEGIVAEIVADAPRPAPEELREFARGRLAPYKVPDTFEMLAALPRTEAGKAKAAPRYRLAPAALAALRAYKSSELLFALHELGALEALGRGADASELAQRIDCDSGALSWMLATAADLGLLAAVGGAEGGNCVGAPNFEAFARLEERLSRTLVTREALVAVARTGLARRPFDTAEPDPELTEVYQGAMGGSAAVARSGLGLRMLSVPWAGLLVEITAGPGRYLERALALDPEARGHLWQVGRLSGPPAPRVSQAIAAGRVSVGPDLPAAAADACVVANAVHHLDAGGALDRVVSALKPEAKLLVDDVFLPDGAEPGVACGAELGLDWITHGGLAWSTVGALKTALAEAGAEVVRTVPFPSTPVHLLLAKGIG